jgi:hypothetical protein
VPFMFGGAHTHRDGISMWDRPPAPGGFGEL